MHEKRGILRKFWKISLIVFGTVLFAHFAKDITQDLLGLKTPLDIMGNIQEDTSRFPEWLLWIYHWAWINATLAQPLIIFFIIKTYAKNVFNRYDLYIALLLGYFISMISWAYYLSL